MRVLLLFSIVSLIGSAVFGQAAAHFEDKLRKSLNMLEGFAEDYSDLSLFMESIQAKASDGSYRFNDGGGIAHSTYFSDSQTGAYQILLNSRQTEPQMAFDIVQIHSQIEARLEVEAEVSSRSGLKKIYNRGKSLAESCRLEYTVAQLEDMYIFMTIDTYSQMASFKNAAKFIVAGLASPIPGFLEDRSKLARFVVETMSENYCDRAILAVDKAMTDAAIDSKTLEDYLAKVGFPGPAFQVKKRIYTDMYL